jgi:hypothetical protein
MWKCDILRKVLLSLKRTIISEHAALHKKEIIFIRKGASESCAIDSLTV